MFDLRLLRHLWLFRLCLQCFTHFFDPHLDNFGVVVRKDECQIVFHRHSSGTSRLNSVLFSYLIGGAVKVSDCLLDDILASLEVDLHEVNFVSRFVLVTVLGYKFLEHIF
jgi:hypothetical protein